MGCLNFLIVGAAQQWNRFLQMMTDFTRGVYTVWNHALGWHWTQHSLKSPSTFTFYDVIISLRRERNETGLEFMI